MSYAYSPGLFVSPGFLAPTDTSLSPDLAVSTGLLAPAFTSLFESEVHVFSINDITGTFGGLTYADNPAFIDTDQSVVPAYVDKDGNLLYGVDSEFGFHVTDFIGAEQKEIDGDYAEGFAGNLFDDDGLVTGIAVRNSPTDLFKSGAPFGTWLLGLGGETVKASTEHYMTMQEVLSDQLYPGQPGVLGPLDDDLKLRDLRPTGPGGTFEAGLLHLLYIAELSEALQRAIDNEEAGTNPQTYGDIDFDRDGVPDVFDTVTVDVQFDEDGDGTPETIQVGGVDLDRDGQADIVDSFRNGYGSPADIVDLIAPNESTTTYDIAFGNDYSVTVKDDGKLLYRFGTAVKRPNDIRMEVNIDLPEEWTVDENGNGVADWIENGEEGFRITRAELVINHSITNNPNDQVRPEDYENEAATGRKPSYYVVQDPDNPGNILWVSPRDSYNGRGEALPSYFKLDVDGEVDLGAGGIAVYDPDGVLVGYRNTDSEGNLIGTVLKDPLLAEKAAEADLDFTTADLAEGFTAAWYTSVDREPFEWSYDKQPDNPHVQDYISFRSPQDAAAAGYTEDQLVSGPRWRLTPNKFGQDLPGLEVPLIENTKPPYQRDNIKYETGEDITTTLNLLDWDGESPLADALGWMLVDPGRLDEDGDGLIDEGWSQVTDVTGAVLQAGDALTGEGIVSAVTPNGMNLTHFGFDTAVYVKGDRQDDAKIYDMKLIIEYEGGATPPEDDVIGAIQQVEGLTTVDQFVGYQGGASFLNPVVFALVTSYNDPAPVSVEVGGIGSDGATLRLASPEYLPDHAAPEDVALLTLEEGAWELSNGSLLQVGTFDMPAADTGTFFQVDFEQAFAEAPILLLQLQTANDPTWEVVRAQNVSATGFEVALQYEEALNGAPHAAEVIGWAAVDRAAADAFEWNGIGAQAFDTGEYVSQKPKPYTFDAAVGTDPLVAAMLTSFEGPDPANLRIASVSDDGTQATVRIFAQEEQSFDDEVGHAREHATGFAFESAGLLTGVEAMEPDIFAMA